MRRSGRVIGAALLVVVLGLAGFVACDAVGPNGPDPTTSAPTSPVTPTSEGDDVGSTTHTVAELGMELTLPADFAEQPSDLPLTLERAEPRTILSIDGFGAPIPLTDYPAREGEEIATSAIDGVDVLLVENAQLEGLPPGVAANTLIADNGALSFSLIMSGDAEALYPAWQQLIDSLVLTPDA